MVCIFLQGRDNLQGMNILHKRNSPEEAEADLPPESHFASMKKIPDQTARVCSHFVGGWRISEQDALRKLRSRSKVSNRSMLLPSKGSHARHRCQSDAPRTLVP